MGCTRDRGAVPAKRPMPDFGPIGCGKGWQNAGRKRAFYSGEAGPANQATAPPGDSSSRLIHSRAENAAAPTAARLLTSHLTSIIGSQCNLGGSGRSESLLRSRFGEKL